MYWSLTEHLLSSFPEEYQAATQAPFLLAAGEGRLPKEVLGKWLSNDRLYIHAYIRAAGKMLSEINLPPHVPEAEAAETKMVDWLIAALEAVRKEERLFIDVASRYGLGINLTTPALGTSSREMPTPDGGPPVSLVAVPAEAKIPGLVMIEDIFSSIHVHAVSPASAPPPPPPSTSFISNALFARKTSSATPSPPTLLPWLEGAVIFWGTERCYLDAWSWARSKQSAATAGSADFHGDADGGALRREFIPNWSSSEFAQFVGQLAGIIDLAVSEAVARVGDGAREEIVARVETKWKSLLAAEAAFWPAVE